MKRDLLPLVDRVYDQGPINSCVPNAAIAWLECMNANQSVILSRMFPYYVAREVRKDMEDSGLSAAQIGPTLQEFGTCLESSWPYSKSPWEKPPESAYAEALKYRIGGYKYLSSKDIKPMIDSGVPVMLSMALTESFHRDAGNFKDWRMTAWDMSSTYTGNHEVLIIGYDDDAGRYLAQNSWGPNWGDGGFFGIPYDYMDRVQTNLLTFVAEEEKPVVVPDPAVVPVAPVVTPAPVVEEKQEKDLPIGAVLLVVAIAFVVAKVMGVV